MKTPPAIRRVGSDLLSPTRAVTQSRLGRGFVTPAQRRPRYNTCTRDTPGDAAVIPVRSRFGEIPAPEFAATLGASKSASTLLVLFIPSHERGGGEVDQNRWVENALRTLGELFGGATAFPQGRGVWRDDAAGGKLHFDSPVVIQCYTAADLVEEKAEHLRDFLVRMGTEAKQGAVGLVIDRDYLELSFPLTEPSESPNG